MDKIQILDRGFNNRQRLTRYCWMGEKRW